MTGVTLSQKAHETHTPRGAWPIISNQTRPLRGYQMAMGVYCMTANNEYTIYEGACQGFF